MHAEPLVSIIIPVYNAEHSIRRTFESLIKQQYAQIELVVIDDCSTDNTLKLIQYFKPEAESIGWTLKIISHTQNIGVATARNTGLDHAKGEYLYYVDADDYIESNAIRLLIDLANTSQADIVGCNWFLSFEENERTMNQPGFKNAKEALDKITAGTMRWNLWLFLVRRSLYEKHQFRFLPRMNMGEDLMMMFKLFTKASKVAYLDKPLYHYSQSNSESLTKVYSEQHVQEVTANLEEIENHLKTQQHDQITSDQLHFLKLNIKLPMLISDQVTQYHRWLNWFPESNHMIMANKALPFRTRIIQWLALKEQFWALKIYYQIVIKFIYGKLYK